MESKKKSGKRIKTVRVYDVSCYVGSGWVIADEMLPISAVAVMDPSTIPAAHADREVFVNVLIQMIKNGNTFADLHWQLLSEVDDQLRFANSDEHPESWWNKIVRIIAEFSSDMFGGSINKAMTLADELDAKNDCIEK